MSRYSNKTIVKMVIAFFIVITALGCDKTDKGTINDELALVEDKQMRYAEKFEMTAVSEAGALYVSREEGLLYFSPIDDGEKMVFCYDPNCKHAPATKVHPDSECMGALPYGDCNAMYYEGYIYFFVAENALGHKIYRMKTDGAGRELVAELPFGYTISVSCIFREDKVYYPAKVYKRNELTGKIEGIVIRIAEVNLLDGSYRFVTEESYDYHMMMDLAGDTLYIKRAAAVDGAVYVAKADINTLEEEDIIPGEVWRNEYAYEDAYDEDSMICWDRRTYELSIINIDGTVEQVLVQGAEGENYGYCDASCDGICYDRTIDYKDEKIGTYFLDLITGEVTNITEEKDKYGIVGYDGYYDVFIARDEEFNWTLWSKEKVLGEARE